MTHRFGAEIDKLAGALEAEVEDGLQKVAPIRDAVARIESKIDDRRGTTASTADAHYTYDYDFIPPLGMLQGIPLRDLPDMEWMVKVGVVGARILLNTWKVCLAFGEATAQGKALPEGHALRGALPLGAQSSSDPAEIEAGIRAALSHRERSGAAMWFKEILDTLMEELPDNAPTLAADASFLDAYNALFQVVPLPAIAKTFQQDASFAELRVAGPNPTSLFRVTELPAHFRLSDAKYQTVVPGDSLDRALADERLYMVDYHGQEPTVNGTFPEQQKYGFQPSALFAVAPGSDKLVPVAVQCSRDPGRSDVVMPGDGEAWQVAKSIVQVADGNFHELVAHLGRTHLTIEPIVVATKRMLPDHHPVRRLLDPHFEGTLFINWAAGAFLTAPKNFVDKILSGTIDADRTQAVLVTSSRSWNDSFLPVWLAAQGTDDPAKLPHYPFRDDALLLWHAIGDWTTAYTAASYADDGAVKGDASLQAWAREVSAFQGGRVAGFGDMKDGGIATTAYLAQALQMIVFTSSVMHAAVNFPQGNLMDYAPAVPLAGYTPVPSGAVSTEDFRRFLPPVKQAYTQLSILYLLGNVYYTRLGDYPRGQWSDAAVNTACKAFQARLVEIEGIISERNKQRNPPYEYLLPSNIPQSINI
jgi:arachidonate 15-lipoxygenase